VATEPKVVVSLRMLRPMRDELDRLAAAIGTDRSTVVRSMLADGIRRARIGQRYVDRLAGEPSADAAAS
jgi:predicted transcriptional regulator